MYKKIYSQFYAFTILGLVLFLESCASQLTKQEMIHDVRYGRITAKKIFTSEERKNSISVFSKFFRTGDGFLPVLGSVGGIAGAAAGSAVDDQTRSRSTRASKAPVKPTIEWGAKEYTVAYKAVGEELVLLDYGQYEVGECVAVYPDYAIDGDGRLDKAPEGNCQSQGISK